MANIEQGLREAANNLADALENAEKAGYRVNNFVTPRALRSLAISETSKVNSLDAANEATQPAVKVKKPKQ